MANENINERRAAITELIKGDFTVADLKRIAKEFGAPYTSIIQDVTFLRREYDYTVYPSVKTKKLILARDNYTCQYCLATDKRLVVDHVIPSYNGGVGYSYNLVACCLNCNSKKKKQTWLPLNAEVLKLENEEWYNKIINSIMEIPKIINKTALAEELGISKQLLDHRLKKGLSKEQKNEVELIIKTHVNPSKRQKGAPRKEPTDTINFRIPKEDRVELKKLPISKLFKEWYKTLIK